MSRTSAEMSSSVYKGNLAPGSSLADSSKGTMRRPTPDSDALASSDDEHVVQSARSGTSQLHHGGRRPSSGWLQDIPRKFSLPTASFAGSNPATPSSEFPQPIARPGPPSAFSWNTSSFASPQPSHLKEVITSPTAPGDHNDGDIGFLLDEPSHILQKKRSQSYSIGQAELASSVIGQFSRGNRSSVRHRQSKPSLLGDLSQLREDEADEAESSNDSEQGVRPPPGLSLSGFPGIHQSALLKQAAEQSARARQQAASAATPAFNSNQHLDFAAVDELDDTAFAFSALSLGRRFSEYTTAMSRPNVSLGHNDALAAASWSLGGAGASADNLGRRHSFATYQTHDHSYHPLNVALNEEDENAVSPMHHSDSPEPFDVNQYFSGQGPFSRALNASAISAAHPAPLTHVPEVMDPQGFGSGPGRPGRRLFIVVFKCSRADIYYLLDNVGLEIRAGDLVITDGDRGYDLGQVSHADVSFEEAKKFKADALDEHFRWLVMFSQYSLSGAPKEDHMLGALARAQGFPNTLQPQTLTSMGGQQEQDPKPKMIKRLAQQHEIQALREKEGTEAKAKRMGQQKALEHKLPMEILDAEFQADYHKLTLFYYAEAYVNFNPLVVDIFKQYKIRIWMSAVNPASVVNPAGLMQIQPPSAIGPGAILPRSSNAPASAVGPGFGAGGYRGRDSQQQRGQFHPTANQHQFEEPVHPFQHQLPNFQTQQFGVNSYSHGYPHGRYPQFGSGFPAATSGYPSTTLASSPMNHGAFYPPGNYTSDPNFNNATPATSYQTTFQSGVSGQAAINSGLGSGPSQTSYGPGTSFQNTYPSASTGFDPMLLAAMNQGAFGNAHPKN